MVLVIKVNPGDNSVQEKGLSLIDPSVIWGACHETSKDDCSLSKIAEGSKDRPFVCMKNLQIFLRSLTLQMWKRAIKIEIRKKYLPNYVRYSDKLAQDLPWSERRRATKICSKTVHKIDSKKLTVLLCCWGLSLPHPLEAWFVVYLWLTPLGIFS